MEAVLLAGGFGTRLRPLTYTRPKPLLDVGGRPMVEWVLDRLPPEVDRVIVAVNWLAEALEDHFAASPRDLEFRVVREHEPLGTAGAVLNCKEHLDSDRFFVLNADIVSDMDLSVMLRQHHATGAVGTISVKQVAPADVVNFGVIDPAGTHDSGAIRIRGFVEKPKDPAMAPSRYINAGAYLLERSVLDRIPTGRLVSMEKEIFPLLLDEGFYGTPFEGTWIDVGDPARLRAASHSLAPGAYDRPGVTDSVLGHDVELGDGARVDTSVVGNDVTIDAGVRVSDCIVGDGEHIREDIRGRRVWSRETPAGYPATQVGNAL